MDEILGITELHTRYQLARRNLRLSPALVEDVVADLVALVGRKAHRFGHVRDKEGYIAGIVRREIARSLDFHLRTCGLGPSERTRRRRLSRGEPTHKSWEPQRQVRVPDLLYESYRRGEPEEYWQFLAWVDETARTLAAGNDRLRRALSLIRTSRVGTALTEVARAAGLPESTLRYQLHRLGEQIVAIAPEWVHECGQKYCRGGWPDASDIAKGRGVTLSRYEAA